VIKKRKNTAMSDFAIWYQKPRKKDFWCEQDGKWHPECQCKTQCFDCGLVQGEMKTQMKKTIEELALEYIASIAGTDPNLDISQYEADYNAFIAGANAVLNEQEQKENCSHPRDKRVYVGRGMLRCTLCDEEFS